jgi:fibronectin-binding autotransporter adhesin
MGGGNTLSIIGNLTNNLDFGFLGPLDKGSISGNVSNNGGSAEFVVANGASGTIGGSLTNSGLVDVDNAGALTISGAVDNFGTLATNHFNEGGGNTLNFTGALTNEVGGNIQINGFGDLATIGGGVTNSGNFYVYNASMATIGGLTNNSGGVVDVDSGSTLMINSRCHQQRDPGN